MGYKPFTSTALKYGPCVTRGLHSLPTTHTQTVPASTPQLQYKCNKSTQGTHSSTEATLWELIMLVYLFIVECIAYEEFAITA